MDETTTDGMDRVPVGELYHSRDLYGDSMVRLREALEGAGFEIELDQFSDRATLYLVEGGGSDV